MSVEHVGNFTQVGPQLNGSNPGGQFERDGTRYYIKGQSACDGYGRERAINEVLSAKLMEAAGAGVVESSVVDGLTIDMGGPIGVVSKFVVGEDLFPMTAHARSIVQADFMVHAWLANHDVIGGWCNNTVLVGNRAVNIDAGGALLFRARGRIKYPELPFGVMPSNVGELDSMRDLRLNGPAAQVYGDMSKEALRCSARKVASVTDDMIRDTIGAHGFRDRVVNERLVASLIARRDALFSHARLH